MRVEVLDVRAVAAAFSIFLVLMLAAIAVPHGKVVLIVGWPGSSEVRMMQIIAAADGTFVKRAGRDWLAIARSDDPALPARLMREGAMIVLDHALAVGCSEESE